MMRKQSTSPGGVHPWQLAVEDELRARPGVMFISLLTDEAGCVWLARGEVPAYLRQQARDALAWCATDTRGLVDMTAPAAPADDAI
jgi:hypothetical protein